MKKSFFLLAKAQQLNNLQMDRKPIRGALRSANSLSRFLAHTPSSTSCSTLPFHPHSCSLKTLLLPSLNFHKIFSQSNMTDQSSQETVKTAEDQFREESDKRGASNYKQQVVLDYILPHILNLYASCATPKDFEIYAPNATFEDPLMRAHGVPQIKSAFYSLAKIFSESRIVDYTVKENAISPGKMEILIDNKQYYKFLGRGINMISLIKLYTEDGKVVRHEDWWDKKPIWNKETIKVPLVGHIAEATRRASMLATHALMRFGKDPTM